MKLPNYYIVSFVATGLLLAGPAVADEDSKHAKRLQDAGTILPLETIIKKTTELYPGGRVVETDFDDDFNRHVYEVEIVDAEGVVWDMDIDATTGDVIKRGQDRD